MLCRTLSRVIVPEDACAPRVQRQVHRQFVVLAVEARLGIGQVVAGQQHCLVARGHAAALGNGVRSRRAPAAGGRRRAFPAIC